MNKHIGSGKREIRDGVSVTPTSKGNPGPPPKQPTKSK
ncbi:hypothetical protein FDF29_06470 [Clostridium botulinum]|uniref:Hypothetical phage protein n=1 Tax=Clostridium botulinum (strain Hall / ATCC 3502 / NCTC 13319 / Type A) TaxID=441771 RepID=A5I4C9_CLOBH|nr:hypothetical protein [Clostridium botulinum]NFQ52992.1 hypothetical protein [Clostridium botulinum]NFT45894.1 hypothetical protein [Clostridium botulinum]QGT41833.1 hypothetical protein GJ703_00010 [Clostridium botulinum]CAL83901.1 hypothetical phage protein [Clostridium botulinum A str. ATCC 3502]